MVAEFIRYHSLLGMHVIVYDRNGAYQSLLQHNNSYVQSQNMSLNYEYYNYTIKGLLDRNFPDHVNPNDKYYDHIMLGARDDDKTLTITHCRFEARSVYGITNVIVLDSDEFFYCPRGRTDVIGQQSQLSLLVRSQITTGVQQGQFFQRLVLPASRTPRACAEQQIARHESVLACFTSYFNYAGVNQHKALHLGFPCPFTDFHQSCARNFGVNDCYCEASEVVSCSAMHLSLSPKKYKYDDRKYDVNARLRKNEIQILLRNYANNN
jgi:hypothetical protein